MAKEDPGFIRVTVRIHPEGDQYVAECVELGLATCADSLDEAARRIEEATSLYLLTLHDEGEIERALREAGIERKFEDPVDETVEVAVHPREFVTSHSVRGPKYAFC